MTYVGRWTGAEQERTALVEGDLRLVRSLRDLRVRGDSGAYERERFDAYARIKAEGLDQWSDLHDDLAGFQDLYQLRREADGTIGCDQVPGLRLGSAARTQDLVQAIAVADGVPVDVVGIVFDPS